MRGKLDHAAQEAVTRLDQADPDAGFRDAIDSNDKQPGVMSHSRRMDDARKPKTLAEAVDTLGAQHQRVEQQNDPKHPDRDAMKAEQHASETNALAILELHRTEVPEFLTEPTHRQSVLKLAGMLDLSPNVAIPWIDGAKLAQMPNAVAWWMSFSDPLALLHQLSGNQQATAVVAGAISAGSPLALTWLDRMPKGFHLDSIEDQIIEQLRRLLIASPEGIHALFRVRFGMPAPAGYDVKKTNDLWSVIGRLPPDHLKQERISAFNAVSREGMGSAAGLYDDKNHRVDIASGVALGKSSDEFYAEERESWLTRAEMQKTFGYDDATFNQLVGRGRIETQITNSPQPTQKYKLKEEAVDLFTQVVLHEVGHSVDDMLGQRTPPVWDFAGWHEYGDATFDQWAGEMGGWDDVTASDKKQIKEAWQSAREGKTSVNALVDKDHPAMNLSKYKHVGIVKLGVEGKKMGYEARTQIGDRVFVVGETSGSWYSLKASAATVAPSDYSLYAPAEYFAESYVEYYRGVDGSPESEARKGGALAGPVRAWFDQHVDKLKYDPNRFKTGADKDIRTGEQPMQASNAPAQAKDGPQKKPS